MYARAGISPAAEMSPNTVAISFSSQINRIIRTTTDQHKTTALEVVRTNSRINSVILHLSRYHSHATRGRHGRISLAQLPPKRYFSITAKNITILIAEDREVVRLGMRQLLGRLDGCEVIGEAQDGHSAIEQARLLRPTIVFVKRDLPGIDGVAAALQIKKQGFGTRIIMLLSEESDFWTSIDSGADGYIMRETPETLISAAIDIISRGGSFIGPLVAHYLLHGPGLPMIRAVLAERVQLPGLSQLSRREKQILRLLIDGLSNQQIADNLGLEVQTVKVHVRNLLKKLGANGRADAVAKVLRTGMTV